MSASAFGVVPIANIPPPSATGASHSSPCLLDLHCTVTCPPLLPCLLLQAAKAQGDFLLVGLHTDEDVQERRGPHLPIMNLHERSLSVLACKYVDEVIIGAPTVISEDLVGG